MQPEQARNLIRSTFETPFDRGRYRDFTREPVNHLDESKAVHFESDGKKLSRNQGFRPSPQSSVRRSRYVSLSPVVVRLRASSFILYPSSFGFSLTFTRHFAKTDPCVGVMNASIVVPDFP
jgi:hypothetical protein